MDKLTARIKSIEINNFKNVKHGSVDLKRKNMAHDPSILGIYGQNGSGKTALIDSVALLKLALSGKPIPVAYSDFINVNSDHAKLKYTFFVYCNDTNVKYRVCYEFCLGRITDESIQNIDGINAEEPGYITHIYDEVLSYSYSDGTKKKKLMPVIDTRTDRVFVPKSQYSELIGNDKKIKSELLSYKKLTSLSSRSFIFSRELLNILRKRCKNMIHMDLMEKLIWFGNYELFIINTSNSGLITLNTLPLAFKYEEKGSATVGSLMINLNESTLIPQDAFKVVEKVINSMNIVLTQLVPGLTISVKNLGTELFSNGASGAKIQLMSNKNSTDIPLKYESEGIKKIISILQLLVVIYNTPSITVAVDELDSGVFEYLLGEILKIISEKGRGQLIFTSHNLRPLETIDRSFIAFTTTNPENRYIRLTNIKTNNNLRDFYYRDIILGEQDESVYETTNNYEIALAFREAGEFSGS